jgi:methyl-accepting chemotaxis protein
MSFLRFRERAYKNGTIQVTDPEVRTRLQFLGLTEKDLGVVATWKDVCAQATDRLVDTFYAHVQQNPVTRTILLKHSSVEKQRPRLTRYVLTLFSGRIDDEYIGYRRLVGNVHDDIDLDSNWYVSMYQVLRQFVLETIQKAGANAKELRRFDDAFSRVILADIAVVITALTDHRRAKIEKLNEEIAAQMKRAMGFIDEAGMVLGKVADRDLTVRMQGQHGEGFERITKAINTAIENLDEALGQVAAGAEEVAAASDHISEGSQSLAQGTTEQAGTLQEVSSSLQEMSSMTLQNTKNAKEARALTDQTRSSTDKGMASMQRMSEAINKIKSSADATARIVKNIDEIAFQTNLLALNAAVEAARAGDAGKGFAVVAEEVRNLAMRSAEAAKQTAGLIEESVKNAEGGVSINQEVVSNLGEIHEQVSKVSSVMSEIANASDQQNQGVGQINIAVEQMNTVVQSNAANSEESASAAEQLSSQAKMMEKMVDSFRLTFKRQRRSMG